jgi:hypothetical protein
MLFCTVERVCWPALEECYVRKSMITCGLSLNNSGIWHEEQLFPRLQALIEKHRNYFKEKPIQQFLLETRNVYYVETGIKDMKVLESLSGIVDFVKHSLCILSCKYAQSC